MEKLFTIEEAAECLRVARQTMYKYMDRGFKGVKLGYIFVGGERRITQSAIDAFIRESTAKGLADSDTIDKEIGIPGQVAAAIATT